MRAITAKFNFFFFQPIARPTQLAKSYRSAPKESVNAARTTPSGDVAPRKDRYLAKNTFQENPLECAFHIAFDDPAAGLEEYKLFPENTASSTSFDELFG